MSKKSRHGRRLSRDERVAIAAATDMDVASLARKFGVSGTTIRKYQGADLEMIVEGPAARTGGISFEQDFLVIRIPREDVTQRLLSSLITERPA